MPELSADETRELLAGTWTVIAAMALLLVENNCIPLSQLMWLLSAAERAAKDERRTAIAGVRKLIEIGAEKTEQPKRTPRCNRTA